jgi:hypothetical protein
MCAMFALAAQTEPRVFLLAAWFAALVAAHVFANAWGHQAALDRRRRDAINPPRATPPAAIAWHDLPAATRLRRQIPLGSSMRVATLACAAAGGSLGVALLLMGKLGETGWEGIVVGGLSAAILGGFFGFLTSSFVQTAGSAWGEADRQTVRGAGEPLQARISAPSENLTQPGNPDLPIPSDELA